MTALNEAFSIRPARHGDGAVILELIRGLAIYERLEHEVVATKESLEFHLFGEHPVAECLLAYEADKAVGFALFFHNFSTFLGKPGIYLEDLFIDEAYRGKGYGKELLASLAALAVERDCGRLEWAVLDWNKPSIEFYKSLGAKVMTEWLSNRLTGVKLRELAAMKQVK